jgi:K+-sensing histidine kinase KdpD
MTYSVIQAPDPGDALIDYARRNSVDHIVIGARASSVLRRYLGSVSAHVVAGAPCSVTVVRTPRDTRSARRAAEKVSEQARNAPPIADPCGQFDSPGPFEGDAGMSLIRPELS